MAFVPRTHNAGHQFSPIPRRVIDPRAYLTQRMVGPVQGKPTEIVTRYMDVFVMRDGRWQCVASQSTRVTAK